MQCCVPGDVSSSPSPPLNSCGLKGHFLTFDFRNFLSEKNNHTQKNEVGLNALLFVTLPKILSVYKYIIDLYISLYLNTPTQSKQEQYLYMGSFKFCVKLALYRKHYY